MLKLLTSTSYVTPAILVRSTPVKTPMLKSLTQLTGWNRSSYELGPRAFSSELGSDTKSTPTTVSTKPNLDDCLTVCWNFIPSSLSFFISDPWGYDHGECRISRININALNLAAALHVLWFFIDHREINSIGKIVFMVLPIGELKLEPL